MDGGTCTYLAAAGSSSTLSIPSFSGVRTVGVAPAGLFLYRNASGGVAIVGVTNGQGSVFGTISGATRTSLFGLLSAIPSGIIDSLQVGAAVAANAHGFLATDPNASAEFGLTGGISFFGLSSGPRWCVV